MNTTRVGEHAAHIARRRGLRLGAAGRDVAEALVEPADQVGQRAGAVRGDDLQLGVAVEEAVVQHAAHRQRGVEGEADRRGELELVHLHRLHARRRGRVDQHRQRRGVDRLPQRRELRCGERLAVDVGQHHHARGAARRGALELGQRELGVLPRQRAQVLDAPVVAFARGGHVVVHQPRRLQADLGVRPSRRWGTTATSPTTSMPTVSIILMRAG